MSYQQPVVSNVLQFVQAINCIKSVLFAVYGKNLSDKIVMHQVLIRQVPNIIVLIKAYGVNIIFFIQQRATYIGVLLCYGI